MTHPRNHLLKYHSCYLASCRYRCQFSGQSAGKKVNGKYRNYHFHHTHPGAYDHEHPGLNYLLLKPWAHTLVHLFGGVLPWEMSRGAVRLQNRRAKDFPLTALWMYPNVLQRLFHGWCRVPMLLKDFAAWVLEGLAIAGGITGGVYFAVKLLI